MEFTSQAAQELTEVYAVTIIEGVLGHTAVGRVAVLRRHGRGHQDAQLCIEEHVLRLFALAVCATACRTRPNLLRPSSLHLPRVLPRCGLQTGRGESGLLCEHQYTDIVRWTASPTELCLTIGTSSTGEEQTSLTLGTTEAALISARMLQRAQARTHAIPTTT